MTDQEEMDVMVAFFELMERKAGQGLEKKQGMEGCVVLLDEGRGALNLYLPDLTSFTPEVAKISVQQAIDHLIQAAESEPKH